MFRYQNQFCAPLVFTKGKKERVGILIFTNTDELWGGVNSAGLTVFLEQGRRFLVYQHLFILNFVPEI